MNTLRQAVKEYLATRYSLGFKLQHAGPALLEFDIQDIQDTHLLLVPEYPPVKSPKPLCKSRLTAPNVFPPNQTLGLKSVPLQTAP